MTTIVRVATHLTLLALAISLAPGATDKEKQRARKHFRKAEQAAARGQFDEMRQHADAARGFDPADARSYTMLGCFALRYRRFSRAQALLDEALTRDPNQPQARTCLGSVLFEQGERERALDEWSVGARLDPKNPEALASYAVGLLTIDRTAEAKRNYETALLRDRRYHDPEYLANRAKGAGWSEDKIDVLRPLIAAVPLPAYPY